MSWTEMFPVFTHEMVDEFESSATPEDRAELEEWYGVESIVNPENKPHIVSFSLFWKNVRETDPDLPEPTRERMQRARELGLARRFDPWDHYVEPILRQVPALREQFPDVAFRVHLAKDLEFLIPDLVEAGCEVWWMKSSSIRFAPGGLWRFLPFGEEGKVTTVADVDRMSDVPNDILRTEAMAAEGLGAWRVPVPFDPDDSGPIYYLPFIGCQLGMQGGVPVRQLLDAFTWHCRRGTMPDEAEVPNCGTRKINATRWPDYGFDEWFLTAAIYPRVAQAGILSFVSTAAKSQILTLDIEYATWANPKSQLIYFPVEGCCGKGTKFRIHQADSDGETGQEDDIDGTPVKLGLLFLTRGNTSHPELWAEYIERGEGVRVFCHPKNPDAIIDGPLAGTVINERHETAWGNISLVRAMLALLRAGLEDPGLTHFVFLSENCVPVRPASELVELLTLDPRSRFGFITNSQAAVQEPDKPVRFAHVHGIPEANRHFQAQWILLERKAALAILSTDLTSHFENSFAPDECYFSTVLSMAGWDLATTVINKDVTWCRWRRGQPHPDTIDHVTGKLLAEWMTSGCFFARKVSADATWPASRRSGSMSATLAAAR